MEKEKERDGKEKKTIQSNKEQIKGKKKKSNTISRRQLENKEAIRRSKK